MYRVALCDDDAQQRERVRQMLLALSVKTGIDFEVTEFASGEQLIAHYPGGETSFHILILDIEMTGLNGIQTARKLREMKRHREQIVFLTSYAEYMLESFDVVTFQYMIKPVEQDSFGGRRPDLCRRRDGEADIRESRFHRDDSGIRPCTLVQDRPGGERPGGRCREDCSGVRIIERIMNCTKTKKNRSRAPALERLTVRDVKLAGARFVPAPLLPSSILPQ